MLKALSTLLSEFCLSGLKASWTRFLSVAVRWADAVQSVMRKTTKSWHGHSVTWADATLHCHRTPIQEPHYSRD